MTWCNVCMVCVCPNEREANKRGRSSESATKLGPEYDGPDRLRVPLPRRGLDCLGGRTRNAPNGWFQPAAAVRRLVGRTPGMGSRKGGKPASGVRRRMPSVRCPSTNLVYSKFSKSIRSSSGVRLSHVSALNR